MHLKRTSYLIAATAAATAGCGGGTSSGGTAAQPTTAKVGQAIVSYFGQPKPLTATSSGSVSVLSQAGATFSSVQMQPAPNLDSTYLVLGRENTNNVSGGIYKYTYPAAQGQLLYQNQYTTNGVAISAYGNVAFEDNGETQTGLTSVRDDGTGLTQINFSDDVYGLFQSAFSTDGTNRLAFEANGALFIGPGTGGTPTLVQNATFDSGVAWNPAGNKLLYSAAASTTGTYDLFTTATTGGNPTDVTPLDLAGTGAFYSPTWSSDGVTAAASFIPKASSVAELVVFNVNNVNHYTIITPSGDSDNAAAFSPDGSKIAFYRSNANGQTAGIYITDPLGLSTSLFCQDNSSQVNDGTGGLNWSPFLPKETVVAASGSTFFHKAASGFIMSEALNQFGSFVAFTATTPADAAIQAPSGTGFGQLIFTVTADAITSIGYINDYYDPGTTISLSSTPTVIVTIDGTTGQVDLVAPAAIAKPSVVKNADGTVTYFAPFMALYNNKGQNLAPNGAARVTVNPQTGKLVAFK